MAATAIIMVFLSGPTSQIHSTDMENKPEQFHAFMKKFTPFSHIAWTMKEDTTLGEASREEAACKHKRFLLGWFPLLYSSAQVSPETD